MPVAKVQLPVEPREFKEWKAGLVKELRDKCFRALPDEVSAAKTIGPLREGDPKTRRIRIVAESGIEFLGLSAPVTFARKESSSVIVVGEDEELSHGGMKDWQKRFPTSAFYAVQPRGWGRFKWTRKSPPNTVERFLVLLGQTADSGRVLDVAAYLAARAKLDKKVMIRMVGSGSVGALAAYAVIFVPGNVDELVLLDPPTSHRDGPHFLNVPRVLDIPEALGLLAPDVKLTIIGKTAKDPAFDRTAAIYKLAGAADKFRREQG